MKVIMFAGAALLAVPALAQVAPPAAPAAKAHSRTDVATRVATHFARLDADRDGFVTKEEADAQRGQARAKRAERRGERREHRFDRLDTNKDGAISRAEFDAAHAQRQARVAARGGKAAAHAGHRRGGGLHGLGGHMFDMADADKDGRVSLQEAQGAALRHFDMADVNRDGQVTREERQQMRQRMRAERRRG